MLRTAGAFIACCLLLAGCSRPVPSEVAAPEALVRSFIQAQQAVMQAGAGEAEVERLLTFLADSVEYQHPRARASIVGRAAFGAGVQQFLGSTRKAQIRISATIVNGGVVVAEQQVSFEVQREGQWRPGGRTQITVFDVEDGRIARMVDFWQPAGT